MSWIRASALSALLIAWMSTLGQSADTAVPKITGPIPSTASPGDPSHNYPFFSTKHLVGKYDYVEEEFFVEGLAVEYSGTAGQTATIAPGGWTGYWASATFSSTTTC